MPISDHVLAIIGAGAGVAALPVAIAIYLKQRRKKRLSYRLVSSEKLLSKKEELAGRVKVLYDEKEVKNISIFTLDLFNSGNSAIDKDDFAESLKITFIKHTYILSAEAFLTNQSETEIQYARGQSVLEIYPILINPKDNIRIKIILDGESRLFKVEGRIKDVPKIKAVVEDSTKLKYTWYSLIGALASFSISTLVEKLASKQFYNLFTISLSVMCFVAIGIFVYLFRKSSLKSKKLIDSIFQD